MRYRLQINVVTPEYKYYKLIGVYDSHEAALAAIETKIAEWPQWNEARKASFRSHCDIVEA